MTAASKPRPVTALPEPVRDVFDLDALEAERTGEPFRFRLAGIEFVLPRFDQLDRRILDETGDELAVARAALRLGLGDQAGAFDAAALSLRGLTELFRQWSAHAGVEPGESQGSAGS